MDLIVQLLEIQVNPTQKPVASTIMQPGLLSKLSGGPAEHRRPVGQKWNVSSRPGRGGLWKVERSSWVESGELHEEKCKNHGGIKEMCQVFLEIVHGFLRAPPVRPHYPLSVLTLYLLVSSCLPLTTP